MPEQPESIGKLIAQLPDEPKLMIGRTILDGLKQGTFTFTNPLASEGGDYDQGQGDYTQIGGGSHDQNGGNYNQSALTGNIGRFDITDLAEIMKSVKNFEQ